MQVVYPRHQTPQGESAAKLLSLEIMSESEGIGKWTIKNYHMHIYAVKPLVQAAQKSQQLNVSRLVLQLYLPNPLKPGLKSKMKM